MIIIWSMKILRRIEQEERRRTSNEKNKITKDGWADYEGKVSRYEDRYPEEKIYLEEEAVLKGFDG
jgi:hypothetical protein